jgi:hypothetical protein
MLAKVKLPRDSTNVDGRKYDEQRGGKITTAVDFLIVVFFFFFFFWRAV